MKRIIVLGALAGIGMSVAFVAAQPQRVHPLPDPLKIKDSLYVIGESGETPATYDRKTGGNTVLFVTASGVVVVDTKYPGYGPQLLEKIRSVTDKPVRMIVNTHTHGDHTGSNEGFPTTVDIVAHANARESMAKSNAFKGEKAQFLPKQTFTDRLSFFSGKDRMELYYFGPGHTNGDIFILFPAVRVLQTGDMFPRKDAPLISSGQGGSGTQFPKTLAKALATFKDVDAVVTGHGSVMTLDDLREYQRFTADLLTSVDAAIKAGKSVDETVASFDLGKYKGYETDRAFHLKGAVQALYAELKK